MLTSAQFAIAMKEGWKTSGEKKAFFGLLPPLFSSNGEIDLQTMLQFSWNFATDVAISTGLKMKAKEKKKGKRISHWPKLGISNVILWRN